MYSLRTLLAAYLQHSVVGHHRVVVARGAGGEPVAIATILSDASRLRQRLKHRAQQRLQPAVAVAVVEEPIQSLLCEIVLPWVWIRRVGFMDECLFSTVLSATIKSEKKSEKLTD